LSNLPVTDDDSLPEPGEYVSPGEAFRIALPNFEGPLDLLLHLIREHKVDILDIPIALITEKYLDFLEKMREINLDIAGEFLVMAATLAHIKSRMLLPRQEAAAVAARESEAAAEEGDPRAELVRRLLEYQKYKAAAEVLGKAPVLDRDVFVRRAPLQTEDPGGEAGLLELSVYKLIEALDRILQERLPKVSHEVVRERVSLSAAMTRITEILRERREVAFPVLFEGQRTRQHIVITFLALLELCKLKLLRVRQEEGEGEIWISVRGDALGTSPPLEVDEDEYR
jgi:segregation and condensation protein A